MIKEGKVWGQTIPLLQSTGVEIHRINIELGGYCSKHAHQSKFNAFYVISGKLEIKRWKEYKLIDSTWLNAGDLEIRRWKEYKLIDSTWLNAGDLSIVPAGEYHQFHAHQETEALEIYWAELSHNDIIRENVGGI
jgi:quercetin dioxygenase-like cupin family protein